MQEELFQEARILLTLGSCAENESLKNIFDDEDYLQRFNNYDPIRHVTVGFIAQTKIFDIKMTPRKQGSLDMHTSVWIVLKEAHKVSHGI